MNTDNQTLQQLLAERVTAFANGAALFEGIFSCLKEEFAE